MPEINGERLLADLKELRTFGAQANGVVRQALSPIDVESRHQFVVAYCPVPGLGRNL